MTAAREIVVVTPADGSDLYAVHQQVWSGLAPWVSSRAGQTFLYAPECASPSRRTSGLWRVRSTSLPPDGTQRAILPPKGRLQILLAATRTERHHEIEIPADEQLAWAGALFARNGFCAHDIAISSRWLATGHKKATGDRIRLPAVHVSASFTVSDTTRATAAFVSGLGRAKRFGFGMLRVCG